MVAPRALSLLLLALLVGVALAGCTSDDGPDPNGSDGGGGGSGGPGSGGGGGSGGSGGGGSSGTGQGDVTGMVINADSFEPIFGASLRLTKDGESFGHRSTNEQGRFLFEDVPAGTYRLEASAGCCRENVERVTVTDGEAATVDVRLDPRSAQERQRPFVTLDDWNGFLGCGVNLIVIQEAACETDESHDPVYVWNVTEGLRTLYLHLQWESQPAGEELQLELFSANDQSYGVVSGESPVTLRIDNDEIEDPSLRFEQIQGQSELRIEVLPGGDAGVVYNQAFEVHLLEFHWRKAPEQFEFAPE